MKNRPPSPIIHALADSRQASLAGSPASGSALREPGQGGVSSPAPGRVGAAGSRSGPHRRKCRHCGQTFYCKRKAYRKRWGVYCSWSCRNKHIRVADPTPEQVRRWAGKKVECAIAAGRLKRQPCAVCGSHESHAHHPDYSRPLDVIWLCRLHHNRHHHLDKPESAQTVQHIRDGLARRALPSRFTYARPGVLGYPLEGRR